MSDAHLSLAPAPPPSPSRGAVIGLALTGVATLATLVALPFAGPAAPAIGLLVLAAVGAVVLDRLGAFHPHPRFGPGNAITLARAGGVAGLAALAVEPELVAGSAGWAAFAFALALLGLDGIDGWLARRHGLASAFGARFDMEVDALLVLVLSAIAFGLGKVGAWILAIGLLRYAFVAAGVIVPALARPLPPSARRRALCALQIVALAVLLAPPIVAPGATVLAATALAALTASFAVDVAWLLRRR